MENNDIEKYGSEDEKYGIDSADLSGDGDVYDLTEEDETEYGGMYCADELNVRGLSDQIKPEHITLGAIVKVVWLVE